MIDGATGLEWEVLCVGLGTCPNDHRIEITYDWSGAFAKIDAMNAASYAGHNDWRLPNVNELKSLVNYGASNPAIDSTAFNASCGASCTAAACSCTANAQYLSSTTLPFDTDAWIIDFQTGQAFLVAKSTVAKRVRAVRGGS